MPKPFEDQNGNGMHVNMSLSTGEKNIFYDASAEYKLSSVAQQFIAGLLRHAPEIACVCNQWVNSYKRLIPGFEAPAFTTWAPVNRSDLIRIPAYRPGKESSVRIEFRQPDPACNPYLAFAAMLTAGIEGVVNKYPAVQAADTDVNEMSDAEREKKGIMPLPGSLYEALEIAKTSNILPLALGQYTYESLLQNKRIEWDRFRSAVTDYELKRYLPTL